MRLWFLLTVHLLLAGCFLGNAAAAPLAGRHTLGQVEFTRLFHELASQSAPWPPEDLVVRRVEAQPATISLSSDKYTFAVVDQPPAIRLGKNALTIAFLVNGKEEGRVRLDGDLLLYGTVLCTARKLDRHHPRAAGDLVAVRRDLGNLDPAVLRRPEEAVGKELKSALPAGAILYSQQLESPLVIKRGDRITIMAKTDQIQVTVPGTAQENGAAGDVIRVKNLMSRKQISARVLDKGLVETEF